MHFSLKNTLFSFVVGLVVFSLLMLAVCCWYFNSEVEVATDESQPTIESGRVLELSGAVIYKNCNGEELEYAVLVTYDDRYKQLLFSKISGDFLMNYRDSMSYVSSVYADVGDTALVELVNSFSGINAAQVIELDGSVAYDDVVLEIQKLFWADGELMKEVFNTDSSIFSVDTVEFPIVTQAMQTDNTHEDIIIINTDETVKKFKNTFGVK